MGPHRRVLTFLAALAVLVVTVQGVTGISELAQFGGPLLLILGFLLSGRFPGEERILARRVTVAPQLRAQLHRHWPRVPDRALCSQLERTALRLRGPPQGLPAGP